MNIVASGKIDERSMRALQKAGSPGRTPLLVITAVMCVIIVGSGLFLGFTYGFWTGNAIRWICLGVLLFPLQLFLTFGVPAIARKSMKKMYGIVNHYVFYEDDFEVNSESEMIKENGKLNYSALKRVIESKDYLFLGLYNNSFYILEKASFAEGEVAVLTEHLKKRVPKYKRVNS